MSTPGGLNNLLLASAAGGGGSEIQRSLRFNSADSAYLSRTPASAGNRTTWTWAGWVKRGSMATSVFSLFAAYDSSNTRDVLRFENNQLNLQIGTSGTYRTETTDAVFRDPSAWYHIVAAFDSTQSTATDRLKLYVNGVEQSVTGTPVDPNTQSTINNADAHYIGARSSSGSAESFFDGYLADIHFIDGQALDPTSFGEFDDNGIWQPIAYSGGSYGTNGFHLDFSDNSTAAALGTDTSGNGNDWDVYNLIASISGFDSWAGVFSGTPAYVGWSGNTIGTSDYCFECFFNLDTVSGILAFLGTDANNGELSIRLTGTGTVINIDLFNTNTINFTVPQIIAGRWYHLAAVRSSGQSTVFLNGVRSSSGAQTDTRSYGPTTTLGSLSKLGASVDGYMSNARLVIGSTPYSPTASSIAVPTAPLTAITNTQLLTFQDSTLIDNSTNGYTLTPSNVSLSEVNVTTLQQSDIDSLVDVPTNGTETDTGVGGEVRGNYATWNPLAKNGTTLSNGNLDYTSSSSGWGQVKATIGQSTDKWYFETTINTFSDHRVGITARENYDLVDFNATCYTGSTGSITKERTVVISAATYGAGDVIGVAFDASIGSVTYYKNGVSQGTVTGMATGLIYFPAIDAYSTSTTGSVNFGQRPFAYTAPSGFKALCTANLDAPTIEDPSTVMDVVTYTGNGTSQTISGLGFSPDLVWIKRRSGTTDHNINDTVRGAGQQLASNQTYAEVTNTNNFAAFTSDGFTVGTGSQTNATPETHVAWTWDAGSSTVSNTDGSITSSVRANASAGFSIVTYTGGAANSTVGHGLGVAPAFIICKSRTASQGWPTYHYTQGKDKVSSLNTTDPYNSATNYWGTSEPTSTVFGVAGVNFANNDGNMVAYCFAPVDGYSSFGSYTGNGSADGPFVYTGFKPRWLMVKRTNGAAFWMILDSERDTYNVINGQLYPNATNAESSSATADFLSNGFKARSTSNEINTSGAPYIYAAFAESPFQYARAR